MAKWTVQVGPTPIDVRYDHIERAVDAACSLLSKEIAFNKSIKDSPGYKREYETHVEVLRLVQRVFADAFLKHEDHQRKMIPGAR
jgi:molybdate-binding protein